MLATLLAITETEVELLVPLAGIFGVFVAPLLIFFAFRYMAYRERMAMIARGLSPGPAAGWRAPTAPPPGPAPRGFDPADYGNPQAQQALASGIRVAAIGLAVTIGLSFIGYGPWLIGGLVPLFIGLSQVLIGLMGGAHFGALRGSAPQAAGPFAESSPKPSPGNPPPTYEGSYTYRPGGTQELIPPSRPPASFDK